MKTIYLADNQITDALVSPAVEARLYEDTPQPDGSGTEVTNDGYTAQTASFVAPSNGATSNTNKIVFGPAQEAWAPVTHIAVHDTATGEMLYAGALSATRSLLTGDRLEWDIGELIIEEETD